MDRLTPALITLALIVVLFALIGMGWRRRVRSQTTAMPPPQRPAEGMPVIGDPVPGMYVATTLAGQPFERVAAHGLGIRTTALLSISDAGVILDRDGTADLLIPADAITGVGATSGMIGKFVEPEGIIVISWHLGDTPVDTGFRTRAAAARTPTIDRIRQLTGETS